MMEIREWLGRGRMVLAVAWLSLVLQADVQALNRPAQISNNANTGAPAAIRKVLDEQVAAWNAGKLEEFMGGYWNSPDLTFVSGGRKLQGWNATLERYRQTYQAEGKEMGQLAFTDLDVQILGPAAAFVRGQFQLKLSGGRELGGRFTLVLRKFKAGWKIIHDHTSSNS